MWIKFYQITGCLIPEGSTLWYPIKINIYWFSTEANATQTQFLNTCPFFFFFFHWHYSPLWALGCRTMSFHFFLSATNSFHLLTPSTWRSLSTSSFHLFRGLPLLLVHSNSWAKIFLGILSSSILSRWPNQLIPCPFIHHHHHVPEGLGMLSCSLILKMKLVPPSLPQSSYVSSSFWFIL